MSPVFSNNVIKILGLSNFTEISNGRVPVMRGTDI